MTKHNNLQRKTFFIPLFSLKKPYIYLIFIVIILPLIIVFCLHCPWLIAFLAGVAIILYLAIVFLVIKIPKLILSCRTKHIVHGINKLFGDIFNIKMSDEERLVQLKERINFQNIPEIDVLNMWAYELKCYKQRLTTTIPILFFIVCSSFYIIMLTIKPLTIFERAFSDLLINSSPFDREFITKILPTVLGFVIYFDEIQKASECLFKIELVKDLKKH